MKSKNVIRNYLYNSLYQLLTIITPIITTPYISRVIGAEGIGTYTSTLGVSQLFCIIGMFGMLNYGSKSIAYVRDNSKELTRTFWNIWLVQLIFSSISLFLYFAFFVKYNALDLKEVFIIQSPIVIGALFDISWLYMGLEDFKKTVSRNILVKVVGIVCIFLFVKTSDDLYKYIAINSISTFLGILTLWMFVKQYVRRFDISTFKISEHLRGAFLMLIPQLSVHFYTGLDRTVIGSLSNDIEVGFYDQAQKISRIALSLVTSLSTVLMPRIANMFSKNNTEKIEEYLSKSLNFTVLISCLLMAGIMGVTNDFVPIFFGEEFIAIIPYMIFTSLIVLFIPLGGVFANQYALPTGKNKEYITPLILAAVINITLNIILVPKLGALGGVISIILTEFITMLIRVVSLRKYINIKKMTKGIYIYIVVAFITSISTIMFGKLFEPSIVSIIIEGVFCTVLYCILIYISSSFIREEVKNIINKYNKRKNGGERI
ncbi:MAG: oligosaccharide flippase family protein [Clostridium sp.]|nr:oligosaccharide flippase family protein [Clostridium sp.]